MATTRFEVIKDGKVTNSWTDDFAGGDHWEPSFGRKDGWYPESTLSDEDKSKAIENRTVTDLPARDAVPESTDPDGNIIPAQPAQPAVTHVEYHLPSEYQINQVDTTSEDAQAKILADATRAQQVGKQVLAYVWAANNSNPNMTPEIFDQVIQDPDLQLIERLLNNGSLKTARAKIAVLNKPYFTPEQIQAVLSMIDNSGLV